MTDELTPALTADEWATPCHFVQCYDSWSDEQSTKTGVGEIRAGADYLTLTSHQHAEIANLSAPSDRHAIAALALHNQPFGFTQEDVDALRESSEDDTAAYNHYATLRSLAARIAALLPPPPPPMETP